MLRIVASMLLAASLAACVSYSGAGLMPGSATEAQVREGMGKPALEFANPDGTRRLAYPRGPLGTQTYMADIGTDGRLLAIRQVLNDDVFYRIQPGMTRDDVLRTIGPPGDTMGFPLSGNYAWDYRFVDTWGYVAIFSVTFNREGLVVSKISQRIDRDKFH
jgi:outer membrane protein assembly factor BamE (lipoprotein component of BamABCDE complex)